MRQYCRQACERAYQVACSVMFDIVPSGMISLHGIQAVETAHQAAFVCAGQFCTAGSRLFAHEDIYDEFMAKAVKRTKSRYILVSSSWL